MDDLISREALKNAIAVARTNYNTCPEYNELFKYFSDIVGAMIDKMPVVDALEVVRCKDCVVHGKCLTEQSFEFCGKYDGFCCVGKRKE